MNLTCRMEPFIHIFHSLFDEQKLTLYKNFLSKDEVVRANSYLYPPVRDRFIFARGWMRERLKSYCSLDPREISFRYTANKKPYVDLPVFFNLSHSGEELLLGITNIAPIGVDIEQMRPIEDLFTVAEAVFTDDELATLRSHPQPEHLFFRYWTKKEAVLKAEGSGFLSNPKQFSLNSAEKIQRITLKEAPLNPVYVMELNFGHPHVYKSIALQSAFGRIMLISDGLNKILFDNLNVTVL